jgi:hypothetical protein
VHLVGFIVRKFITMHGHVNVKKKRLRIAIRFCFTSIINERFIRPASLRVYDHVTHCGTEEKNGRSRSTSFPSYWGPIFLSRNKPFTNSESYLTGTDVQYSSFNSIQGCTNLDTTSPLPLNFVRWS